MPGVPRAPKGPTKMVYQICERLVNTQLYSPFEKAAQLYTQKNESENLTNQQNETLKKTRYLAQSTQ